MRRVSVLAFVVLALCGVLGGCGDETRAPPARTLEASDVPPEQLERVVTLFNRGVGHMAQYRPLDAVEDFEKVVELAPRWTTARLNLGIALLNCDKPKLHVRAEAELKRVIAADATHPVAHYALGMLLIHLGRSDEARAQFERVLEIDPDDVDTHYQLGSMLLESDSEKAARHLHFVVERVPHHASAYYRLVTLAQIEDRKDDALRYLDRFQALRSTGAGVTPGMKYGEMGRYAAVVRLLHDKIEVQVDGPPPRFTNQAAAVGLATSRPAENPPPYGPGVAAADVDGDGALDLYLPGTGPVGGALYRRSKGRWHVAADTGIDGRDSIGAWFADYDGDGRPDLYLTCGGPNRLYHNEGGGRFADVTASSGTAGAEVVSVGAAWADADHDGDLDLYVANCGSSACPNVLWRNNGDGTFREMAAEAGIDGGAAATVGVAFFDADGDRDLDLYLVNAGSPNRLFLNDRTGRYRDASATHPELGNSVASRGVAVGDVDADGRDDLVLLNADGPPRLLRQVTRGRYEPDDGFLQPAETILGVGGGLLGDLDLDGDLDLVLLDARDAQGVAHRLLLNDGRGRYGLGSRLGEQRSKAGARGAFAVDLDDDGMLEILVTRRDGAPELFRAAAPPGRHWLTVVPEEPAAQGKTRPAANAIGLGVEIQTGRRMQRRTVMSSSGYLGGLPPRVHFGLGAHGQLDYARFTWPDGMLQSELEVAGDRVWRAPKVERKPSSCPLLFSWDGTRFAFVTDFLGVGGVGFFAEPGVYAPPDPTEDVRIPPKLVALKDGRYLLRVAEPLEEVTYLDELHLKVYDHPASSSIYPDERFGGVSPEPTGAPQAIVSRVFPVRARDDRGRDVLPLLASVDRRYVEPPVDARFVGYARDHWLELDFGDRVRKLPKDARVVLFLHGWVEYTYSHVNYAAGQAGLTMKSPCIEVPDGKGGWRVAVSDAGFPAGLPRMMTLDVSKLPLREDGRLRLRTNMEIFWDQAFVAADRGTSELRVHTLRPSTARLRVLGYPREYSPDGNAPTLYDYARIDPALPFRNMAGRLTRLGDVRELLTAVDDRFVIIGRGEEILLEFDARALPPLRPGRARTLVLHTDGYCKDMDLYTAFPDTIEPLPFHGMGNYPPQRAHPSPETDARYQERWNTRRVPGR